MAFPIKVCAICSEECELKPDKPGFATHCPDCSAPEYVGPVGKTGKAAGLKDADSGVNEARRQAMRDLLYKKDS